MAILVLDFFQILCRNSSKNDLLKQDKQFSYLWDKMYISLKQNKLYFTEDA